MPVGISLGWNCYSAVQGVGRGYRPSKAQGYKTCPFDEMLTNYEGIVDCINDGLDPLIQLDHLRIVRISADASHCANDDLIQNSKYKFFFNHESPGHANLYVSQNWSGGKDHYVANDYEKFRERYGRRIQNFKNYCTSGDHVNFLITRFDAPMPELHDAISHQWPNLSYSIVRLDLEDTPATPLAAFYEYDTLMKLY